MINSLEEGVSFTVAPTPAPEVLSFGEVFVARVPLAELPDAEAITEDWSISICRYLELSASAEVVGAGYKVKFSAKKGKSINGFSTCCWF